MSTPLPPPSEFYSDLCLGVKLGVVGVTDYLWIPTPEEQWKALCLAVRLGRIIAVSCIITTHPNIHPVGDYDLIDSMKSAIKRDDYYLVWTILDRLGDKVWFDWKHLRLVAKCHWIEYDKNETVDLIWNDENGVEAVSNH